MSDPTKSAEVRRILDRYVVEVVERYELCPWSRTARERGEIGVEVVFGQPTDEAWIAAARAALAGPSTRVAMVVAPELVIDRIDFHDVRNRVAAALPTAGVAEFHPDASIDLATPARLVPFLRRSPDPLLQLVPLALLESVRASPQLDRAAQIQILAGVGVEPPRDVAAHLAAANHAMVTAKRAAIEATLDDITEDRRTAYARVGLSACP
ncbi:MAG: DUF1415 family protein [Deltaproteobacteria bacterium]|nr:DUF1415 family protein [Deltaproteobacteria bacterium]